MSYLEDPASRPLRRGAFLKLGAAGTAALAAGGAARSLVPELRRNGFLSANGVFDAASTALADVIYIEAFPTSPLILSPFRDPLLVPKALAPVPKSVYSSWAKPPGPGAGQQNSIGNERAPDLAGPRSATRIRSSTRSTSRSTPHAFTTSQVLPIDAKGKPTVSFDASGKTYPAGTQRTLPPSTIYGFNGTFPGPRINAEYGKPASSGSRTTSTRTR